MLMTNTGRCGIDLELMRPRQRALMLANHYFGPNEASTLSALPEKERLLEFYRLWTLKEAKFKSVPPSDQRSFLSARFSANAHPEQSTPDAFWQILGLFSLAIATPHPPQTYIDEFFQGTQKTGALNLRPCFLNPGVLV